MPISEDEVEYGAMQEPQSTMSKAELRKTHKPIMEKRRRARINQCLNEIKSLILEAMNKDPSRHAKLEKADILEMAVRHLQDVQRRQLALAVAADPAVLRRFRSGFSECAGEIDRYMGRLAADADAAAGPEAGAGPGTGAGEALRAGIGAHLRHCIGGIERAARLSHSAPVSAPAAAPTTGAHLIAALLPDNTVGDHNNNPKVQLPTQGVRLIPSRLPTGELALVLPNAVPAPAPAYVAAASHADLINNNAGANGSSGGPGGVALGAGSGLRPSAFAAVVPTAARPLSPPPSPPRAAPGTRGPSSPPRRAFKPLEGEGDSPKAFKPVQPQAKLRVVVEQPPARPDHQVAHVSSTSTGVCPPGPVVQTELKSMRFPIRGALERERDRRPLQAAPSPRKLAEPLCIITNQSERYRQAQARVDSADFAENAPRQGTKRKLQEYQGLLAVAALPYVSPPPQPRLQDAAMVQKLRPASSSSSSSSSSSGGAPCPPSRGDPEGSDTAGGGGGEGGAPLNRRTAADSRAADVTGDMWRPW